MNKNRLSILSTKELNPELVQNIKLKGIELICTPFIEIKLMVSIKIKEELRKIIKTPSKALIFTSQHSVLSWIKNVGKDTGNNTTIFCISGKTRDLCAKFTGVENIIHRINALKLVNAMIKNRKLYKNLFYLSGNKSLDTITNELKIENISCNQICLYENRPLNNKIDFIPDAILFFSPSAVESFLSQNSITENTTLFAIGEITAKEIAEKTGKMPIISDFPSPEKMIHKLYEHYQSNKVNS